LRKEKLPNLPNLPKYGNGFYGDEVGLGQFFEMKNAVRGAPDRLARDFQKGRV
jgi:hypothetical protein